METTTNPFEAPRTTDLEVAAPTERLEISPDALRELIDAAPWLRWLARVTSLSIAVSLVKGALEVIRGGPDGRPARLLLLAVGTPASTAILLALRRYATASSRLSADPRGYAPRVIAGQAAFFRRVGVVLCVCLGPVAAIAVVALIFLVAAAVAR
jgi:hypothetical protein